MSTKDELTMTTSGIASAGVFMYACPDPPADFNPDPRQWIMKNPYTDGSSTGQIFISAPQKQQEAEDEIESKVAVLIKLGIKPTNALRLIVLCKWDLEKAIITTVCARYARRNPVKLLRKILDEQK